MRISDWSSDVCSSDLTHDVSSDDTPDCPTDTSSRRRPTHTQVLDYVVICSGSGVEMNVQKSRSEVTSMSNVSLSDHRMITAGNQIGRALVRERVCPNE